MSCRKVGSSMLHSVYYMKWKKGMMGKINERYSLRLPSDKEKQLYITHDFCCNFYASCFYFNTKKIKVKINCMTFYFKLQCFRGVKTTRPWSSVSRGCHYFESEPFFHKFKNPMWIFRSWLSSFPHLLARSSEHILAPIRSFLVVVLSYF